MRVEEANGDTNVVVRADEAVIPAITSAAAGGIRCSLNAMLAWMQNWLDPTPAQLAWLSEEQRKAMWTPRTLMPVGERRQEWNNTHFHAYAFGFRLADVDGVWTVSHTGTLMGMYSVMTLLPDIRSGFVMLTNGQGGKARTALNEVLTKHFTAPEQVRTIDWYAAVLDEPVAPGGSVPDTSARIPVAAAEAELQTGIWRDPWFGEVAICARDAAVRFEAAKSPRLAGTVMQVGERYLVDWDDDSVDAEAWLEFAGQNEGTPRLLRMAKVDPQADFSFDYEDLGFARERDCE
jgi:hypothetical protein